MAGITVTVNAEIINWILQEIRFNNVAGSAIELLEKWRSGEKMPTFNQVESVSKQINIPFGYFLLDTPPVEACPMAEYRTVHSLSLPEPSRNLIDTIDAMTDIQEWMINYMIENGQDALSYVGSAAGKDDILSTAGEIRTKLGIEKDWYRHSQGAADSFKYLRRSISELGILIMMNGIVGNNTRRKLNVDEFRAFTLVNQYVPLIFINTCDSDTGKLFSLLHELAHVWRGVNSLYNNRMEIESDNDEERICNAVAAEILVPQDVFLDRWRTAVGTNLEKIAGLAKYFRCSRFVIARRAYDFNKVSKNAYREIVSALTEGYMEWREKQNKKKNSGGDYYTTLSGRLDHKLIHALANSAREGRTPYTEVFRLTHTNRKTFGELLSKTGGAG